MNPNYKFDQVKCGALYKGAMEFWTDWTVPGTIEDMKKELLGLPWETRRSAREEYFMATSPRKYSYGNRGTGSEEYQSRQFSRLVLDMMFWLNSALQTEFNVCFLNKYNDEKNHLGWHADDFPGMRVDQPIACVSFGAAREIWVKDKRGFACERCGGTGMVGYLACLMCNSGHAGFQIAPPKGKQPQDQRFMLEDGSLFVMPPGYQDTHVHRIPKHDRPCGWRISLTFRSFK